MPVSTPSSPASSPLNALQQADQAAPPTLGVFDSGVGGLTVLQALRARMPEVALHYVADAGHAPYGDRSSEYIRERSLRVAEHLRAAGARMVVVACNTATAHAVNAMRERWPDWPVVGIEPGVKPAVAATRNGRIGVMGTTATIASRRYEALVAAHAAEVSLVSQPCPGLVTLIEQGHLDNPELGTLIDRYCEPLKAAGVDTVLLGCTHYPLVQGAHPGRAGRRRTAPQHRRCGGPSGAAFVGVASPAASAGGTAGVAEHRRSGTAAASGARRPGVAGRVGVAYRRVSPGAPTVQRGTHQTASILRRDATRLQHAIRPVRAPCLGSCPRAAGARSRRRRTHPWTESPAGDCRRS